MKETAKKANNENKINLRELDDITCSNVVVIRQIRKMIKKFPSMKEVDIDCWSHGGHYTKFNLKGNKFVWSVAKKSPCISGCESLSYDNKDLYSDELSKLLVYTYRAMCDSQDTVDLVDTPEDLLAYAETKLQEMLREENTVYAEDVNTVSAE